MPNFWTSSYGLKGDPYAELRLTTTGSRLGIPLSGGKIELQEIKMLNKLEAFGKQDEAINFAGELNKFDRGLVEFKKNPQGRWRLRIRGRWAKCRTGAHQKGLQHGRNHALRSPGGFQ